MTSLFEVKEHVIEGQHIREYPRATAHSQEEVLQVAVKQYIPINNPNPRPGDVTIIGAHANGFPKELYEALWEDLLKESSIHGFRIRAIWIADVAWQGKSGIINEWKLGNDPSWLDASRDLLHMTNLFRSSMPRPIVGLGHSFGGVIIANLSLMHPRLMESLVLIDPVIAHYRSVKPRHGADPMTLSSARRDLWPSRTEAAASFKRSPFYRSWDSRVLEAWVEHGLRDTPTAVHPATASGAVTLATTKHQEVFTYLRPRRQRLDDQGRPTRLDLTKIRDIFPEQLNTVPAPDFYQPESARAFDRLPHVSPGVLYIFGGKSDLSTPDLRRDKLEATGTGVGGSGGVEKGRVAEFVVENAGHLVPMEAPGLCAQQAAAWIGAEMRRWREEEKELMLWWSRPDVEKYTMDETWKGLLKSVQKTKPKL